jgi:homoserine kinase
VLTDVTAFAPATVANVGIGFDILGHTVDTVGDRVRLRRIAEPVVRIRSITGIAGDLPIEPAKNTAGRAVQAMHAALGLDYGFEIDIDKGIPLASGMGGSAASAVGGGGGPPSHHQHTGDRRQRLEFRGGGVNIG